MWKKRLGSCSNRSCFNYLELRSEPGGSRRDFCCRMAMRLARKAGTVALKPYIKRRKDRTRCKPLPPSKRLRLEAQRVLKDRVQDIADKKGIKLRFCNLKDCEGHMKALDSPCASIRTEIGWPREVPFVHPHDLPNKAKLRFLEAYEPGWTDSQPDMENQSP